HQVVIGIAQDVAGVEVAVDQRDRHRRFIDAVAIEGVQHRDDPAVSLLREQTVRRCVGPEALPRADGVRDARALWPIGPPQPRHGGELPLLPPESRVELTEYTSGLEVPRIGPLDRVEPLEQEKCRLVAFTAAGDHLRHPNRQIRCELAVEHDLAARPLDEARWSDSGYNLQE